MDQGRHPLIQARQPPLAKCRNDCRCVGQHHLPELEALKQSVLHWAVWRRVSRRLDFSRQRTTRQQQAGVTRKKANNHAAAEAPKGWDRCGPRHGASGARRKMSGRRKETVVKSGRGYIGSSREQEGRQYSRPIYRNHIAAWKQIVTYLQSRMRLSTPSRVPTTPAAPLIASRCGSRLGHRRQEDPLKRRPAGPKISTGADGLRIGRVLAGCAGRQESRSLPPPDGCK
jgi:hypothetical protein